MAKKGLQKKTRVANKILTVVFSLVSLLYLYPLVMMVLNSFKKKAFISRAPFAVPTDKMFAGLANYELGIARTNFWGSMVWSVVITVLSVFLILLCTSMCAWFISRVVNGWTKLVYLLCIFSMVVPFQMVMFTLSKLANTVQLNTPWTIPIVYLGFGAGLAVFMFTGYMRSCPIAIEESAMIDGASQLRIFTSIVIPISKPLLATISLFLCFGYWNDWFLSSLYISKKNLISLQALLNNIMRSLEYMTNNPTAGVSLQQYRAQMPSESVRMAIAIVIVIPIACAYPFFQKYFISGLTIGAVKG